MTKILYLDCSSGISGDMFLGSLIDCGLDIGYLRTELSKIEIKGYKLRADKTDKGGIAAVKFDIIYDRKYTPHPKGGTLKGLRSLIKNSSLSMQVKDRSIALLRALAEAESTVHAVPLEKVHFHEIGELDSVVDIVGSCIAIEKLGIDQVYSSPLTVGCGRVMVHGKSYPNPAPATAYLLKDIEINFSDIQYELVTPTGAAIVKTFAMGLGNIPPMKILKVGYGAGTADIQDHPNLLRSIIGETSERFAGDTVAVIETNLDDMNPQIYEYLIERLLEAGALDVYLSSVVMKKSRPGCVVTVVTEPSKSDMLCRIIFEETTTFGLRLYNAVRQKLLRKIVEVKTKYGNINVKVGLLKDRIKVLSPEYEDCKRIARAKKVPFVQVYKEAERAAKEKSKTRLM